MHDYHLSLETKLTKAMHVQQFLSDHALYGFTLHVHGM